MKSAAKGKLRNHKGFTLVQLMIVTAISSIVVSASYDFFLSLEESYRIQNQVVDVQDASRIAIGMITEDIRKACYDPNQSGNFKMTVAKRNEIQFGFDEDEDGELDLDSEEDLGYRLYSGKLEVKTYNAWGSEAWETVAENVTGLNFTYYDVQRNEIAYSDIDDAGEQSNRNEIKNVEISLTLRTAKEDPEYLGGVDVNPGKPGTCRTRTLANWVEIRNH